jgi:hypothetical protein
MVTAAAPSTRLLHARRAVLQRAQHRVGCSRLKDDAVEFFSEEHVMNDELPATHRSWQGCWFRERSGDVEGVPPFNERQ